MSDIFNKLNGLKGKLAELEKNVVVESNVEVVTNTFKSRIESKIPLLISSQKSKVRLDIGNECILITTLSTIKDFPYKLTLKEHINIPNDSEPYFIDSSEQLFTPILDMIRYLSENPQFEGKKLIKTSISVEAVAHYCKEYFLEDTSAVLEKFDFIYTPNWIKRIKEIKKRFNPNKWMPGDYIQCYSCSSNNDGTFWKKRCSYDRQDDSYCINFFIATCTNCDPENTLSY